MLAWLIICEHLTHTQTQTQHFSPLIFVQQKRFLIMLRINLAPTKAVKIFIRSAALWKFLIIRWKKNTRDQNLMHTHTRSRNFKTDDCGRQDVTGTIDSKSLPAMRIIFFVLCRALPRQCESNICLCVCEVRGVYAKKYHLSSQSETLSFDRNAHKRTLTTISFLLCSSVLMAAAEARAAYMRLKL